jgi:hypothetical protein
MAGWDGIPEDETEVEVHLEIASRGVLNHLREASTVWIVQAAYFQ